MAAPHRAHLMYLRTHNLLAPPPPDRCLAEGAPSATVKAVEPLPAPLLVEGTPSTKVKVVELGVPGRAALPLGADLAFLLRGSPVILRFCACSSAARPSAPSSATLTVVEGVPSTSKGSGGGSTALAVAEGAPSARQRSGGGGAYRLWVH